MTSKSYPKTTSGGHKAACFLGLAIGLLMSITSLFGAFGLTTTTNAYTIDTNAGLVFSIRRVDINNQMHQGDISSMKFNGVEFQDQTKGSQVGVGLTGGSVTVGTNNRSYIVIVVTATDGGVTHYYMARSGYPHIYMATYFTSEPSLGNVRYITRALYSALPHGPAPSDLTGNTGAIESSDIFGMADGTTRSKHYSGHRQIDWTYTGATGTGVGLWMVKGSEEGMSGGPFYRSLINQASSGGDQEIYEMINYGEAQTEAFRTGVLTPYTLVFTTGGTPATPDLSWQSGLGLTGYVATSGRGNVVGVGISGRDTAYQYVVGWANSAAQYWSIANASTGAYSRYGMLPGTYTQTIYKGELAVWTGSVTVTAGASTPLHTITITGDPSSTAAIWRIGNWDGTGNEFLNANRLTYMHPQDSRMSNWGPVTFTVGTTGTGSFPCAQFRGQNSPTTISFNLTAAQAAAAHTIRIGITCAYIGGRPSVTINGHALTNPGPSSQPSTRCLTIGTYRENNTTFTYAVPAADLVTGTNTMVTTPISGTTDLGLWLSAGYGYDCIDFL